MDEYPFKPGMSLPQIPEGEMSESKAKMRVEVSGESSFVINRPQATQTVVRVKSLPSEEALQMAESVVKMSSMDRSQKKKPSLVLMDHQDLMSLRRSVLLSSEI